MKSYLEGCGVPTTRVGQTAVPRLIMGNHPYDPVDGYLTPVNRLGALMNPTPETALAAIREAKKPILAIKPLAGGRYLGHKAFEYVFNQVGAAAALFGMGTLAAVWQPNETMTESQSGHRDSLRRHRAQVAHIRPQRISPCLSVISL